MDSRGREKSDSSADSVLTGPECNAATRHIVAWSFLDVHKKGATILILPLDVDVNTS